MREWVSLRYVFHDDRSFNINKNNKNEFILWLIFYFLTSLLKYLFSSSFCRSERGGIDTILMCFLMLNRECRHRSKEMLISFQILDELCSLEFPSVILRNRIGISRFFIVLLHSLIIIIILLELHVDLQMNRLS